MSLPNFGYFGEINNLVNVAVEAEEAGWDGFFIWDHMAVFKENHTTHGLHLQQLHVIPKE